MGLMATIVGYIKQRETEFSAGCGGIECGT